MATPSLLIAQCADDAGRPRIARVEDGMIALCALPLSTLAAVEAAIAAGGGLSAHLNRLPWQPPRPWHVLAARLLPPITHPDPARLVITGTGLTHLGSADARDRMHAAPADGPETDSIRMFRMGLDGGRPPPGRPGVQPEWFFKGDGTCLAAPGAPLVAPPWAEDAGEEPELVGIYVNGPDGRPWRVGFAVGNEFSDHAMERRNYLYLAHSKLRPAAIGPCIRLGLPPDTLAGLSRIRRDGELLWERPFVTGAANMTHSIANLEHHHFKYALFRQPGQVNLHFVGTATLSFSDGLRLQHGDEMEISLPGFGPALRNVLHLSRAD